jgi:hypothetical protein
MFDSGWTFHGRFHYIFVDGSLVSQSTTGTAASAGLPSSLAAPADVLSLFQQLLPNEFFDQLRQLHKLRENQRVYNAQVVMWLMTTQRMQGGTMASSVLELLRGLPPRFWPLPCKRLRPGPDGRTPRLSANTASYNDARQALPLAVVEAGYDQSFAKLTTQAMVTLPEAGKMFLIDGSSVRTACTPELCQAYPPAVNQNGESHFPVLRILVAHDACTGLAMRPQWGPMYGPQAVSEQALLIEVLNRC